MLKQSQLLIVGWTIGFSGWRRLITNGATNAYTLETIERWMSK